MITRLLLPALLLLSACQSTPPSTAPAGAGPGVPEPASAQDADRLHKAGLVLMPDLYHASAWEKLIHVDMGVPSRKIKVTEGPGFTTLTIYELKNRADAESIAVALRQYAERNPQKFGPTKVEVSLGHDAPTISPFILPTDSGGTLTPGPALPTLSLPPLQLDAR